MYIQKRPIHIQNSPMYIQKSPTYIQNSLYVRRAMFLFKCGCPKHCFFAEKNKRTLYIFKTAQFTFQTAQYVWQVTWKQPNMYDKSLGIQMSHGTYIVRDSPICMTSHEQPNMYDKSRTIYVPWLIYMCGSHSRLWMRDTSHIWMRVCWALTRPVKHMNETSHERYMCHDSFVCAQVFHAYERESFGQVRHMSPKNSHSCVWKTSARTRQVTHMSPKKPKDLRVEDETSHTCVFWQSDSWLADSRHVWVMAHISFVTCLVHMCDWSR